MKSHVAIYKSHEEAVKAVEKLSEKNFPMDQVSLIGSTEIMDDHLHVKSIENMKLVPFIISIIIGVIVGPLIGLGIIAIPGLNFNLNNGIWISLLFGASSGLTIGAILTIFTALIFQKDKILRFKKHVLGEKYLVIVNGTEAEISKAEHILHTEGTHKMAVA